MGILDLFKKKTLLTQSSEGALGILFNKDLIGKPSAKPLQWYETFVYVNRAIEKRGEKVGEIQFRLRQGDNEIDNHEILSLLAKPNPNQTGYQFFKLWQEFKDIYGEVFILILKESDFLEKGKKHSLIILDPKKSKPNYDKFGMFTGVEYDGVRNRYLADEVIFDSRPNPADQLRGVSLLKSGATLIETAVEFENQNYRTVKSGGKVEGVISIDSEVITEENQKEFFASYQKQLSELPENSGAILLGGNAKYQDVAKTMKELGYLETKKLTLQDVCILCDVPKVLLNALDDVKYDNADASIRMFLRDTIRPLMEQITTKINEKYEIVPEGMELTFVDPTPSDLNDALKINASGGRYRYLTINEMRENVGLEPMEGGDELPKAQEFDFSLDDEEGDEEVEKGLKKKDFIHPLKSKEFRIKYHQKKLDGMDRNERIFKREFNKYLKGQKERLLEGMVGNKRKDLIDSSFNQRAEIAIGVLVFLPLLRQAMEESGREAYSMSDSDYSFNWTSQLEASLNKRAEFFIGEINKTTFNKLKSEFAESLEAGEGRRELVKRIENTYGEISKSRANTIARTEVHYATNQGTLEGYKQAGIESKTWVSALSAETRDWHAEMDGVEIPMDMPFIVDGEAVMFPGEGSPHNSINCQCVI